MGLDITAYRQLVPSPEAAVDDDGYPIDWQTHFRPGASLAWSEEHWPGRCPELAEGTIYAAQEQMRFRAGSYSGYGAWREQLAKLSGYQGCEDYWERAPEDAPFYEIINFADNEGTIGAAAAAALAKDFVDHQTEADAIGGWFGELYNVWRRACEMAADAGAIDFH